MVNIIIFPLTLLFSGLPFVDSVIFYGVFLTRTYSMHYHAYQASKNNNFFFHFIGGIAPAIYPRCTMKMSKQHCGILYLKRVLATLS